MGITGLNLGGGKAVLFCFVLFFEVLGEILFAGAFRLLAEFSSLQ